MLSVLAFVTNGASAHAFEPATVAVIAGALTGFLFLNTRLFGNKRAFTFLGDAGSTLLGFFLVYLLIDHSQGTNPTISPVLAGWILGLPLLDGSAVITSRILDGKSPFLADRTHLHHLLQDLGFSVNQAVVTMLGLHIALMIVGTVISLTAGERGDLVLFWGFVLLVLLRIALANSQWALVKPENVQKKTAESIHPEHQDAI
jgi:UDP-GlcNAc:undecaprenyl-phosphate GlcNAc-1-phosphate transferase